MTTMRAIDVSAWNGTIDYSKIASAGIKAVIVRVGCNRNEDEKFTENFIKAKRAGLLVGGYYVPYVSVGDAVTFSSISTDASDEAKLCIKYCSGLSFDLPIFCDWEYSQDKVLSQKKLALTVSGRTQFIKKFCNAIQNGGLRTGIYTNPDYINYKLNYADLKNYPLFLASYVKGENLTHDTVNPNQGPSSCLIWQFTAGKVNGHNGTLDLDYIFTS